MSAITINMKSRLFPERTPSCLPRMCFSLEPLILMAAVVEETEQGKNEENHRRLRSRTTPPATNQCSMSSSLDSGVGSFEETDVAEKSCTTDDVQPQEEEQYENPTEGGASFRFIYLGSAVLDKRYTQAMLPWVIAEVRRRKERSSIYLNVEEMMVKAIDCSSSKTLFQHQVQTITRCARSTDKKSFSYLTKIPDDVSSCHCYVFEAVESSSVRIFALIIILMLRRAN